MVAQIVAAIISIAKAVPVVDGWLRQLFDGYVEYQISQINRSKIGKQEKISVLMGQIGKAKTHEEKAVLLASLDDIKRLV